MKKPLIIALWYILFITPTAAAFMYSTQTKVAKPMVSLRIKSHDKIVNGEYYLFGDSCAKNCPRKYPCYAVPSATIRQLVKYIPQIPCDDRLSATPHIVAFVGGPDIASLKKPRFVVEKDITLLRDALTKYFPNATITVIDPWLFESLHDEYGTDGWHINANGYEQLFKFYPTLSDF